MFIKKQNKKNKTNKQKKNIYIYNFFLFWHFSYPQDLNIESKLDNLDFGCCNVSGYCLSLSTSHLKRYNGRPCIKRTRKHQSCLVEVEFGNLSAAVWMYAVINCESYAHFAVWSSSSSIVCGVLFCCSRHLLNKRLSLCQFLDCWKSECVNANVFMR